LIELQASCCERADPRGTFPVASTYLQATQ